MRPHSPILIALGLATALAGCRASLELAPDDSDTVLSQQLLEAADPGQPGPYTVRRLYYGSGTDRRRAEFRDSVTLRTPTVDASKFVSLPENRARERKRFWGFGPDSFPVNGRVWYPEGDGPFPLVLTVHGNHDMRNFSDPGYGYLGELLASRGCIFVSVDMNFLNGAIRNENDARGWMLLQHLVAWRGFDADSAGPFHARVDLDRVALIGHSRGGEAVAHAAAFNRMSRYPDDATVEFDDFGFGIRSLVAIAPVDGQYRPADRLVPLENVNYFVFHGSHDGDVSSFMGLPQYHRVRFRDGGDWFKSAMYVYRANHGQWNTVWGPNDWGPRSSRGLDLRGLLDEDDQRRFGELYISAFLEATLKDDRRYLPMFVDHRVVGGWLPRTMYMTRFEDASFRVVADFEEDVDVTTGSLPGVTLRGDSLAVWREARVPLRWRDAYQGSHAVWLGWNNRLAGEDTTRYGPPASYTVTLPDTLAEGWGIDASAALAFSLAPTTDVPGPREAPEEDEAGESQVTEEHEREPAQEPGREPEREVTEQIAPGPAAAERGEANGAGTANGDSGEDGPIDLTLEAVDLVGASARLPLSRYGVARKPLELRVFRRRDWEREWGLTPHELVLQTYSVPLSDFVAANPEFRPERLREVRFVFDITPAGTVVIDDIGFHWPEVPVPLPPLERTPAADVARAGAASDR